jgi:hypothetical protein
VPAVDEELSRRRRPTLQLPPLRQLLDQCFAGSAHADNDKHHLEPFQKTPLKAVLTATQLRPGSLPVARSRSLSSWKVASSSCSAL